MCHTFLSEKCFSLFYLQDKNKGCGIIIFLDVIQAENEGKWIKWSASIEKNKKKWTVFHSVCWYEIDRKPHKIQMLSHAHRFTRITFLKNSK